MQPIKFTIYYIYKKLMYVSFNIYFYNNFLYKL